MQTGSLTRALPIRLRFGFALAGLLAAMAVTAVLTATLNMYPMWPYLLAFTAIGWAIGLPVVLAVPHRPILQMPWLVILLGGAMLGGLTLKSIFFGIAFFQALLGSGLSTLSLKQLWMLDPLPLSMAGLSSAAAVAVYAGLYRSKAGY
jgi:hypothetical protein